MKNDGNPGGPFGPVVPPLRSLDWRLLLFFSSSFLLLFQTPLMSLGVFFRILKYVFQEAELRGLQGAAARACSRGAPWRPGRPGQAWGEGVCAWGTHTHTHTPIK